MVAAGFERRLTAANRRFAVVATCAFALVFAADAYLFSYEGFRRTFGNATQEGQELSKVERGTRIAAVADVLLFGSSYVRSGISGEPFLERGLIPFNFAASGAGPLYDFFALRRIAPVLRTRARQPLIMLELKREALEADTPLWAEYPQYLGIVRSRAEMIRFAPLLWRSFKDYGMTSQFVSSVVLPSSIYRSYGVQLLAGGSSLEGFFYGMEDFSGYSPLYTVAAPSLFQRDIDARPLRVSEGKRRFLVEFLRLARELGAPAVLYASPTLHPLHDSNRYDALIDDLRLQFPEMKYVRGTDYALSESDFDEGGHPNISGADAMSRQLIGILSLQREHADVADRLGRAFAVMPIPPAHAWVCAGRTAVDGDHGIAVRDSSGEVDLAAAKNVGVTKGVEHVLEAAVAVHRGRFGLAVSWADRGTGRREQRIAMSPVDARRAASTRLFLRFTPNADTIDVNVVDASALANGQPSSGRIEVLRLLGERQ